MANRYDNIPERSRIVFDIRDECDFVQQFVQKDGGTLQHDPLRRLAAQRRRHLGAAHGGRPAASTPSLMTAPRWMIFSRFCAPTC